MRLTSITRSDLDVLLSAIEKIQSHDNRGAAGDTAGSNAAIRDTIRLVGFKESQFEDWQLLQQGADVRITFPDGKSILLRDRQVCELSADQFQFGEGSLVPPALHRRSTRSVTEFASDLRAERAAIGQDRLRNFAVEPSTQGSSANSQESSKPLENLPSISFAFASPRVGRAAEVPVMSSMDLPTRMPSVDAPVASAGTVQFAFAERQPLDFAFAASAQ